MGNPLTVRNERFAEFRGKSLRRGAFRLPQRIEAIRPQNISDVESDEPGDRHKNEGREREAPEKPARQLVDLCEDYSRQRS